MKTLYFLLLAVLGSMPLLADTPPQQETQNPAPQPVAPQQGSDC